MAGTRHTSRADLFSAPSVRFHRPDKKLPTVASKFRGFPFPFLFFSLQLRRTQTRFDERARIIARSRRSRFSTPFPSVFHSPVIFEENSTPERLISDPDTRCAYHERENLFVHRFSFLAPLLLTAKRYLGVRPLAASVRFQTPSAFAVPLSKHNTTTAC